MLGWLAGWLWWVRVCRVTWHKADYVSEPWHDVHETLVHVQTALERCHTGSNTKVLIVDLGNTVGGFG